MLYATREAEAWQPKARSDEAEKAMVTACEKRIAAAIATRHETFSKRNVALRCKESVSSSRSRQSKRRTREDRAGKVDQDDDSDRSWP